MRKFSFNLQRVTDVRELRRRLAEERLGLAVAERVRAEKALEEAVSEERRVRREIGDMTRGVVNTAHLGFVLAYRTRAEEEVAERQNGLEDAEARLETARREALLRINDHEVMLKLKKRRFMSYLDDYWWDQGKTLDEVGLVRHARKTAGIPSAKERADGVSRS